ncbi:MAG TPA: S8 family serine peptidase [Thermoanaerobaculia bacterium]|nr:S8 family serine peptidase [Thermoanaerobaculia bacterium]
MQRRSRVPSSLVLTLLAVLLSVGALAAEPTQRYLIQCNANCSAVATAVQQIPGASVDYQFQNITGLVATVPLSAVPTLQSRADVVAIAKDVLVAPPQPLASAPLAADGVQKVLATADVTALAGSHPADYEFNNDLIGASTLHAQGTTGAGVVVAIIDTGTANNPAVVADIAGSVLGGENFVTGDPVTSATSTHNGAHGTWVGTMIAGHAIFLFNAGSTLVQSLQLHAPNSVIPCSLLGCPTTLAAVPVIGVAPGAKIYALKVFSSLGGGAPTSRIAAAMDRAITLKKNFNNGVPSVPINPGCGAENNPCVYNSLNIQVVNMSLGGLTLFAGRDVEDLLTTEMLKAGITLAVAAGNAGPGAFTSESPGTGPGALTAAAASTAPHERILRDLQFGLGVGDLYRPFDGIQTATFSSRGPSADGRFGVNVSTNGFANFCQGANGGFSLVSGTSFASPTTAGAAALLRQKFPTATATQIRNAIIAGANPNTIADGSGKIDQGSGFLDIPAAAAKLAGGHVSSSLPTTGLSTPIVDINILPLGILVHDGNSFTTHVSNLKPGQVAQYYIRTFENTSNVTVTLKNITPALPPAQQNAFFGDDVFLTVLDTPTSQAVTLAQGFLVSDTTIPVGTPQSGLLRVAVQGDSTNAGSISADLVVQRTSVNQGAPTSAGTVGQGQEDVVLLNVPAGKSQLTFQLSWLHDWGFYPTNDIDLIVEDPNGNVIVDGATLNSPERVVVNNPVAGTWTARIQGFQINQGLFNSQDLWALRVRADGQPVPRVH